MRKILILFFSFVISVSSVCAEPISKTIDALKINKGGVSVSVKDLNTGNKVYSLNANTPMNPASTLKLITFASALNTLGFDYEFTTSLYKSTNNDLYLKLSGDPFLSSANLDKLFATAKSKNIITPKHVYIDASIFDDKDWGEGWQWDDDLNPLMPRFGAYNLDKNLLNIEIMPNGANQPPKISVKPFYPLTFMNSIDVDYAGKASSVKFSRNSTINTIINASGVVSDVLNKKIPVPNLRRYFVLRIENAIRSAKIEYYDKILNSTLPDKDIYLVESITHDMSLMAKDILKNSNNSTAESVFKMAGYVWSNSEGTTENSLKMLNSYLENLGLDPSRITVVDGSGVSKNNLITADFMTDFLVAFSKENLFEDYKMFMVSPGEGTLKDRMLYFKDNLKAKTGTLFGISSITGYITTRKGKEYAFDIIVNDSKASSFDKKNLEEQILRQIYMNY